MMTVVVEVTAVVPEVMTAVVNATAVLEVTAVLEIVSEEWQER